MPTEIGESSKVTFDLKFLATIGVIVVSACATYFSITGQVDDNKKEERAIRASSDHCGDYICGNPNKIKEIIKKNK